MRTVTYDKIKALTEARLGNPISGNSEDTFKVLLDDAVRSIYDMEDFWPRYLRVEPRSVIRGYISDTEDAYHVYGAGTPEVNGLYVRNGTFSTIPAYTLYKSDGTTAIASLWSGGPNSVGIISNGEPNSGVSTFYEVSMPTSKYPNSGWEVIDGDGPAPIVQPLGEIGRILHRWDGKKWSDAPELLNNYRDANGIRCTNGTQNGTVWVAYKEALPGVFGDGTGDTISDIPEEFSRYVSLRIRYDMADAARQGNPAPTHLPSYRQVQDAALDAMMGITREGAMETIKNIHRTYYSYNTT
jgi:hypothetical protein